MQANMFFSCSLKEWAILLALKGCFTDESISAHNLICFKSGLNRVNEWWNDKISGAPSVTQYLSCPSSFPCLQSLWLHVCGIFTENRRQKQLNKGKVTTAKVLLWQKKPKCTISFMLDDQRSIKGETKASRYSWYFSQHISKPMHTLKKKKKRQTKTWEKQAVYF